MKFSKEDIHSLLSLIPDPEIPVVNISELGILRAVEMVGDEVVVTITPTYSGCPAMKMIEDEVRKSLKEKGIEKFSVRMVYSPAWTTDWMNEEAKEKLKKYGISP